MNFKDVHPDQFKYNLPKEKIAKFPLENRSDAKLLHYNKGQISDNVFNQIENLLPKDSTLIFNDTRVIPARLIFHKETGARIEVFLLDPVFPSKIIDEVMTSKFKSSWNCMIGNAKKWKNDTQLNLKINDKLTLTAKRVDNIVEFSWDSEHSFSEIIELSGKVPLPPYLEREPLEIDTPRYQTVYSENNGAVAAPTAGLHFTESILNSLAEKHTLDYVTLHVSAGTFQPITTSATNHPMHSEQVIITRKNIETLLSSENIIAVGTTSLRTLESIFWYGVNILEGNDVFKIEKLKPYQSETNISKNKALHAVLEMMDNKKIEKIIGSTEIFLFPGYEFRIVSGLITNFHLPGTTLMMLIAAFIGDDWEKVYNHGLTNDYRFLSYGDSSLLIPK